MRVSCSSSYTFPFVLPILTFTIYVEYGIKPVIVSFFCAERWTVIFEVGIASKHQSFVQCIEIKYTISPLTNEHLASSNVSSAVILEGCTLISVGISVSSGISVNYY